MLVWGVKASAPMWQTKQAELQFGEILPSLAIRLDGPLSARGNFMSSRSAPSPSLST
jgi:hypothetical protein